MLTPDKLKNKTFQTTGKGSYRAEEVDSFMQEVSASYEQVFRENGEIIKKMSILANKVEEYKKDEDSLRSALLSAQKLADQITAEAQEKADNTLADANAEAQRILTEAKQNAEKIESEAKASADEKVYSANKEANDILGGVNRKVTQEKLVLEMLQKEVGAFKNKMMDMYKEHLTLLDRMPQIAADEIEKDSEAEPVEQTDAAVQAEQETEAEAQELIQPVDEAAEPQEANDDIDEIFGLDSDEEEAVDVTAEPETESADEAEAEAEPAAKETAQIEEEQPVQESFKLDESVLDEDDDFEDVASGADEEGGFKLDLSDVDFEDEEEEESKASEYASADEMSQDDSSEDDDDEDDDGGISFKRFFRKK